MQELLAHRGDSAKEWGQKVLEVHERLGEMERERSGAPRRRRRSRARAARLPTCRRVRERPPPSSKTSAAGAG